MCTFAPKHFSAYFLELWLQCLKMVLVSHLGGRAACQLQVTEARDAAKRPTVHRAVPTTKTKPGASSAEGNPALEEGCSPT